MTIRSSATPMSRPAPTTNVSPADTARDLPPARRRIAVGASVAAKTSETRVAVVDTGMA